MPRGQGGGGLQAAFVTWPEVLLTYGRDSSLGSRLTEHQVSEQRESLSAFGTPACGGGVARPSPGLMWGMDRQASGDFWCYWQVAETPENWPALIWQQQRELAQLRHSQEELLQRLCTQLEGLQSTVTGHVERALESRHEQERILGGRGTAGQRDREAAVFSAQDGMWDLLQVCSLATAQSGDWSGPWPRGSSGVGSCRSS